jgi:hypothetical protein
MCFKIINLTPVYGYNMGLTIYMLLQVNPIISITTCIIAVWDLCALCTDRTFIRNLLAKVWRCTVYRVRRKITRPEPRLCIKSDWWSSYFGRVKHRKFGWIWTVLFIFFLLIALIKPTPSLNYERAGITELCKGFCLLLLSYFIRFPRAVQEFIKASQCPAGIQIPALQFVACR